MAIDNSEIKIKLKEMLVRRLSLRIQPEEIKNDAPLFREPDGTDGGGLGLDSVEALEIIVGIEEVFNLTVEEGDYYDEFYSIDTIAEFVGSLMAVEA